MKNYDERIKEKIEELADGRVHQYKEVEAVIIYVIWLSEQKLRAKIKNAIDNLK